MSLLLLRDELALLADPAFVPSCSIDPVLSCGTIMRTEQAAVLGFPQVRSDTVRVVARGPGSSRP